MHFCCNERFFLDNFSSFGYYTNKDTKSDDFLLKIIKNKAIETNF